MKSKLFLFAAVLAILCGMAVPAFAHSGLKLWFGDGQTAANFGKVGGVIDCYYNVSGSQLSMNCYCPDNAVCELNVDGTVIATETVVNAFNDNGDDDHDDDDEPTSPVCVPPTCWPPPGYGPYWPKP